jgi:hypothetical protein
MTLLCKRIIPMFSLPFLYSLWQTLGQLAEKVEARFKAWTRPATSTMIEATLADLIRTKPELIVENAFLRQQLIVLERQVKHPTFTPLERGLLVALASRVPLWKHALLIIKPDTLLMWHRQGFRLFWRHKSQGPIRQPRLDEETITLIKRMALDNRRWGTKRIRGELLKLGLSLNRGTIRRYMRRLGGRTHPSTLVSCGQLSWPTTRRRSGLAISSRLMTCCCAPFSCSSSLNTVHDGSSLSA